MSGQSAQVRFHTTRRSLPNQLLLTFFIALFSGAIGELYVSFLYGSDGSNYFPGFRKGFSIGLISAAIEIFYVRAFRRSWIRRVAFLPGLLVRILVLTLIVRVCLVGNELLTDVLTGQPLGIERELGQEVRDTLFSMALVIAFVILSQLTSIIGLKRFINLVVGRYFRPVSEKRVFLFVDLVGSSRLARILGDQRFHEYLSEFFHELDQAIVASGGEIVSYVGDAVIVTWPLGENRNKNARCLRGLGGMLQRLKQVRAQFEDNFGEIPEFRAALHGGNVVVGECGDSRRQVTFLGDVVNLTGRMEGLTKELGETILASQYVLDQMGHSCRDKGRKPGRAHDTWL